MTASLADQLVRAAAPALRPALRARADLQGTLQAACAALSAQGVRIDDAALVAAVARALAAGTDLDAMALADLGLAECCARGDAGALRLFAAHYGPELDRAIGRSPTLGLAADEFRQLVFDRLFVAEADGNPRIRSYVGKGPLKGWVRVLATRLIIDLGRRRDRATVSDDGLAEKLAADSDAELSYLRETYGPALDTAFAAAVGALSVRHRNLLRQRYLHEVPADTLSRMYGVHRSTVFLWLDQARTTLLQQLQLALSHCVPGDRLQSVVEVLGSQLQLSVRRMLDSRLETESG